VRAVRQTEAEEAMHAELQAPAVQGAAGGCIVLPCLRGGPFLQWCVVACSWGVWRSACVVYHHPSGPACPNRDVQCPRHPPKRRPESENPFDWRCLEVVYVAMSPLSRPACP